MSIMNIGQLGIMGSRTLGGRMARLRKDVKTGTAAELQLWR